MKKLKKLIAGSIEFVLQRPFLSAFVLIFGISFSWILWATYQANNTGFSGKSLWDWMELLIIPVVLAIGAWWLNRTEKLTERKSTEVRIRTEREIASDGLQEAALQTYLDRMTDLLLNANLRESDENDEVRSIAWSRTLTILRGLDKKRKGLLLLFLYESRLIGTHPIVTLKRADFSWADLRGVNIPSASLRWTNFKQAELAKARLEEVDLSHANLEMAGLQHAKLQAATLYLAYCRFADFSDSDLSGANLQLADLNSANLRGAFLKGARLRGAILSSANLQEATLEGADLTATTLINGALPKANLKKANFSRADLRGVDFLGASVDGADFSLADLTGAKITEDQLAQAISLTLAILPDST